MLNVRFRIAGEDQYARAFEALGHESQDMSEPLGRIRDRLVRTVGEQFLTDGTHGGTPWQMLSPEYAKWKSESFPGRPLLVLSGAMRRAFLVEGTRELDEHHLLWGITDQVDDEGNRIAVRAQAHQTGSGVVPMRKIVALRLDDKREFDHAFADWFNALRHRIMGAA